MAISTRAAGRQQTKEEKLLPKNKRLKDDDDEVKLANWQFYFAYCVLASCISCLIYVFVTCHQEYPATSFGNLKDYLKIPSTVGDAKRIGSLVLRYKDDHYYTVFGSYFSTYILLQSFCIPGSIVLSILAGYLFPAPLALLIICVCSTIGASTFYIMISNRKKSLLKFLTSDGNGDGKVDRFNSFVQAKVKEYKSNLFICVFLLRATPIFPNWTINLCSPIINIPLRPFVWGTFTGVAPLSVIHVWTGRILNDLSNDQSLVNWQSVLMTSLVAISIVFLIFVKRYAK